MATVKPIQSRIVKDTGWLQGTCEPMQGTFYSDGFYKSEYKTKTGRADRENAEPYLCNADGHDHMGHFYNGTPKHFSQYA